MGQKVKRFPKIVIPEFVFTDGSVGVFSGFDRQYSPADPSERPKWIWTMGIFDHQGNYFYIEIDTRKSKMKKTVQFIVDGEAYYHPINGFYALNIKINPLNGHSNSCSCNQCNSLYLESEWIH
jgi:hypothetical protein